MDPRMKVLVIASLFLFLIPAASCGLKDNAKDQVPIPTPSAAGMGSVAVKSAVSVDTFLLGMLDQINANTTKSAKDAQSQPRITFPPSINCDDGGTVTITPTSTSSYTAAAVDCATNGGTLVINATADVSTTDTTTTCDTGGLVDPVPAPASFTALLNGTVTVSGVDFQLQNLGMAFTNVVYRDRTTCNIDSFDQEITGAIAATAIESTFNFGTSSVLFNVSIQDGTPDFATVTANGSMTVDTPCLTGSFTMTTTQAMMIQEGATCPFSGAMTLSGDVNGNITFPDDCDSPACLLGT